MLRTGWVVVRRMTRTSASPNSMVIPRGPPVQRRPVHPHPGGYLDNISAIKDRTDRVQALLDNRQDNQSQSRPPPSDVPRKRRTRADLPPGWKKNREALRLSVCTGLALSAFVA
jgi:hypothetical protein